MADNNNLPIQQLLPPVVEEPLMSVAPVEATVPVVGAPVPVAGMPQYPPVLPDTGQTSQYAIQDPAAQQKLSDFVNPPQVANAPLLTNEDLATLPEQAADALTSPTSDQIALEFQKLSQPYQQARARFDALDKIDALRIESEKRQAEREEQLNTALKGIDDRVRSKSLAEIFQSGSTGQKIGAAFAMLAGGVSQGLTGAKSNPVVDFMDRIVEQQSAKDKLSMSEKEALRKQVYQQGQNELKKLESATQNAYRKDQLSLMSQELDLKKQELLIKLKANVASQMPADMFSGRQLKPDEVLKAKQDKNVSERLITLPNGKAFLANNDSDAKEFKKFGSEALNALTLLEKYRNIGAKGSQFSLTDRAQADSLRQALIGALRLPFSGPGAMTQTDIENIIKALGDPLALTTVNGIELTKIDQVADALRANTINKARLSGVTGEVFDDAKYYNLNGKAVREDKLVQMYQQKLPNLSEQQIKAAISKSIPGL